MNWESKSAFLIRFCRLQLFAAILEGFVSGVRQPPNALMWLHSWKEVMIKVVKLFVFYPRDIYMHLSSIEIKLYPSKITLYFGNMLDT